MNISGLLIQIKNIWKPLKKWNSNNFFDQLINAWKPDLLIVPLLIDSTSQRWAGAKFGPISAISSGSLTHVASWSLQGASGSGSGWCSGPCGEWCSVCGGVAVCSLPVSRGWGLPWHPRTKSYRCWSQTTSSRSHAWGSPHSWSSSSIIIRIERHVWAMTAWWARPRSRPRLWTWS